MGFLAPDSMRRQTRCACRRLRCAARRNRQRQLRQRQRRRGSPGACRVDRQHDPCRGRVEQFCQIIGIGKKRGRVAVGAHAKHDDIERSWQRLKCRILERCRGRDGRGPDRAARNVPRRPVRQEVGGNSPALERGDAADETLIDQRHGHLVPGDRLAESTAKNCAGVEPPDTASSAGRARRRLRQVPATSSASAAASSWRRRAMPVVPALVQLLSCQVRPSRSISAIEAEGPQVPAV